MLKNEKKIILEPTDDLKKVLNYLEKVKEEKIVLIIPSHSALKHSLKNFEVLKEKEEILKKKIFIESLDEEIKQLAAIVGLETVDDFFFKKEKPVLDILPRRQKIKQEFLNKSSDLEKEVKEREKELDKIFIEEDEDLEKKFRKGFKQIEEAKKEAIKKEVIKEIAKESLSSEIKKVSKKSLSFKKILGGLREKFFEVFSWRLNFKILSKLGIIFLFLGGVFFLGFYVLPKAEIKLYFKDEVVDFEDFVEGQKDILEISVEENKIFLPIEVLTVEKNLEKRFLATAREKLSLKAKGKLVVYNSYSSAPQILVATTRFLSPEGKIFRLDKQITIPGARVVNNKIEPSSIVVEVTADQPGADYNIDTGNQIWRIPGFEKTPKYEGFYAVALEPMKGGFVGERSYPSKDDLEKAQEDFKNALKEILKSQAFILEKELRFFENDKSFRIKDLKINTEVDEQNRFSIFGVGQLNKIAIKESLLKGYLIDKYQRFLEEKFGYGFSLKEIFLDYLIDEINFEEGKIIFKVKGKIVFQPDFDKEIFKKDIKGLREKELRGKINDLKGLERAKIELWPFWVYWVPFKESRISISVE